MIGIRCCLNCTERHPACWDSCEKYAQEKSAAEAMKQARKKEMAVQTYLYDSHMAGKLRWQRTMYCRAGSAKSWMGGE